MNRQAARTAPFQCRPRTAGHFLVKRVTHAGTIRFRDRLPFLANALKEHHVGLAESDDGIWSLDLGAVLPHVARQVQRNVRQPPGD